jgi:polygalacturonase
LRIKTSSSRGGIIENIFLKDIQVGAYKESAVHCNMFYENPGSFMPVIRNIWIENLDVCDGGEYTVWVNAYKESPVTDLRMVNCNINGVNTALHVNHVKNMKLNNVNVNGKRLEVNANGKIK